MVGERDRKSGACESHGHLHVWVGFGASQANGRGRDTYKMANLRGLSDKTGNRAKQMTKHAKAATLKAPKMRSRSHRLTVAENGANH